MKLSESWLREWVNPQVSREELAHQITMAGLEVDGIAAVAGVFTGVKIGQVVECAPHPDADKLRVTKVDVGEAELLDIVCGAANCRTGLKVAVATVGAVLPGDFTIKKAKLRGQPSHGMLCSFSELGIDLDSEGIIELPQDAPLGEDFRAWLSLDDATIEVDLTANRADCFSLRGMAREVAVINRLPLHEPTFTQAAQTSEAQLAVDIQAPQACPRYLGRIIEQVNVKAATPLWMVEKLRRSGIRSIDPIVDITNFVMLEQGQPMHAFDLNCIEGGIVVRMAQPEETLVLLDGTQAQLSTDTLVIADQHKALAIAGIFGGQASGVSEKTHSIVLESAFFAPDAIRGRARRYGLHTDSSARFERGVDHQLQYHAIERATELILAICGGQAAPIVAAEAKQYLPSTPSVVLRRQKLDALLGHVISDEDVVDILQRLGMQVSQQGQNWQVQPPSWRFDIAIEQDLIEEVGRIYGYDNIPNQSPIAKLSMRTHQEAQLPLKRVKDLLVDRGFYEAITYSFVEPELQRHFVPEVAPLILPNPISAEMSAMRLTLIQGLLNTVVHNQKRQQTRVRLFEQGLRFIPDPQAENGVRQEPMLAGVISGNAASEHWNLEQKTVDFFDLKGDLEAVLALSVGRQAYQFVAKNYPALHPGQSAAVLLEGKEIGFIGTLHPELERKLGLHGRTIVFEVQWQAIAHQAVPQAKPLSKFPANRRDIALVVDRQISADEIVQACVAQGGAFLRSASLFDVYTGQGIAADKKSLAIALLLQSDERTLEEADISQAVDAIVAHTRERFAASLRD